MVKLEGRGASSTWIDDLHAYLRSLISGMIHPVGAVVASISQSGASLLYRQMLTFGIPCWYIVTPPHEIRELYSIVNQDVYIPNPATDISIPDAILVSNYNIDLPNNSKLTIVPSIKSLLWSSHTTLFLDRCDGEGENGLRRIVSLILQIPLQ
jgi:hypothetical protein